MIVLIIFVITVVILKLLKAVLNQVEAGRLQLPGIHPDTVGATRKLISVVVRYQLPIRFYLGPIHLRLKALVFSLV